MEDLIAIVGKSHPLAGRTSIRMEDLRDESFIVYQWNNFGPNAEVRVACHRARFEPQIVSEAFNDYNVVGQVSAGEDIAVISSQTAMDLSNVSVLRPEEEDAPTRILFLIRRKDIPLPPSARKFRDFIMKQRKTTDRSRLVPRAIVANKRMTDDRIRN